jgi:hypothetical protein
MPCSQYPPTFEQKFLAENLKYRNSLGHLGLDGKIILKLIFEGLSD